MRRNTTFFWSSIFVVLVLSLPAAAAEIRTSSAANNPQIAEQLRDFKQVAHEMRQEADALDAFSRNRSLHWSSHTHKLNVVRDHVNDMGKKLAELEAWRPLASEAQRMAIENVRPHLVEAAQNLSNAIGLVGEDRGSIRGTEYMEAVRNVYEHAEMLYQKLDTILDYDNAKLRLESLNLEPAAGEGS